MSLAACCNSKTSKAAPHLLAEAELGSWERGEAQAIIEAALGGSGRHQFTTIDQGQTVSVYSYAFGKPFVRLYFVFREEKLDSIVHPPPTEHDIIPFADGTRGEVQKPVDPFARMEAVSQAKHLSGQERVQWLRSELRQQQSSSYNVLPAFVISSPSLVAATPRILADYRRNAALSRRFNASSIEPKASREEVNKLFGAPLETRSLPGGAKVGIYGERTNLQVNPADHFSWVAVVFGADRVTHVFSNDFFDSRYFDDAKAIE